MSKFLGTLALVAVAFAGTAAQAQVAGTYTGTTADGGLAQITIIDDGTGQLVFTGDSFQWTMNCSSGDTKDAWWGVGQYVPIVAGVKTTAETALPYLYENVTLKFSADGQTASGTFVGDEPMYVDIGTSKKVESCKGKVIKFTATLDAPAALITKPAYRSLKMNHAE